MSIDQDSTTPVANRPEVDAGLRVQTACCLTVRYRWDVADGENHPEFTFGCSEDREMAAVMAFRAAEVAPRGIGFLGADTSATGGRSGPWVPLDLGPEGRP
ncbi:MAG TPA: hypothetical protein VK547_09765 [Candidatus Udaeobacter sp.]|nr:hypothetical protein [Candidatus Udaeobacter sp.]